MNRGHKFEGMSGADHRLLGILSFVERGVVHDHHGAWRASRQQFLHRPGMENLTVNSAIEQTGSEQGGTPQCTDPMDSSFSLPVVSAVAALSARRIAMMGTRHVVSQPAFVNVDEGFARRLVGLDLFLKCAPCVDVRFGRASCFFIGDPSFFKACQMALGQTPKRAARSYGYASGKSLIS